MEARVIKLENAFASMQSSMDRIEMRLERVGSDLSDIKVSNARIDERMERVMDRARDIPTVDKIDSMLNTKLAIYAAIAAVFALISIAANKLI